MKRTIVFAALAVLAAAFAAPAMADDNKVVATITGENYCLHCSLVMADDPKSICGPETCQKALKVTEAKDAEGNVIEGLKGVTLHYLKSDNAKALDSDEKYAGKQVEIKGMVYMAERAVNVQEVALVVAGGDKAAAGDDFSDFDDFDFSAGGNKASARR